MRAEAPAGAPILYSRPLHGAAVPAMNPDELAKPLTDREVAELDRLLATIPDERDPLDVAMLDGFLAGVLLAPDVVLPSAWLPYAFAADGGEVGWQDAGTATRTTGLVMRRYNELAAYLAAREAFDPIVFELADDAGEPVSGRSGIVALAPWAAGFARALDTIPSLGAYFAADDDFADVLGGVLRHLPLDPDDTSAESAAFLLERRRIDREIPLADLDDAIDELVACVLDAVQMSRPNQPVTRAAPKVGRNDPCPCGSGKKYKACHGRGGN